MVTFVVTKNRENQDYEHLVQEMQGVTDVAFLKLEGEFGDGRRLLEAIASSEKIIYWT